MITIPVVPELLVFTKTAFNLHIIETSYKMLYLAHSFRTFRTMEYALSQSTLLYDKLRTATITCTSVGNRIFPIVVFIYNPVQLVVL